jgi:hypothetical protein
MLKEEVLDEFGPSKDTAFLLNQTCEEVVIGYTTVVLKFCYDGNDIAKSTCPTWHSVPIPVH